MITVKGDTAGHCSSGGKIYIGEHPCVGMVVGSITSLTAAWQLRMRRHEVTVYDEVNDFDAVLTAIAKGV